MPDTPVAEREEPSWEDLASPPDDPSGAALRFHNREAESLEATAREVARLGAAVEALDARLESTLEALRAAQAESERKTRRLGVELLTVVSTLSQRVDGVTQRAAAPVAARSSPAPQRDRLRGPDFVLIIAVVLALALVVAVVLQQYLPAAGGPPG